jgi:hypothetical protein
LTHAALSEAHPQETQHRRPPSRRSPDGADRSTPQMVQLLRYPSLPPLMAAEAPPALLTPHGHVRSQPAKTASLRTSLSGEPSQFRKSSHLCEPLHLCSSEQRTAGKGSVRTFLSWDFKVAPPSTSVGDVHSRSSRDRSRPPLRQPNANPAARSAPAVSHSFDGLLHHHPAGLLRPAADPGVHLVSEVSGAMLRQIARFGADSNLSARDRPYGL